MYFDGRTANYDKEPYLEITQKDAQAFRGFEEIADCLKMRIKQLQKERIIDALIEKALKESVYHEKEEAQAAGAKRGIYRSVKKRS